MADLAKLLGVRYPIVQAPMAGGPDTPALVAAVGEAGGLGSLGCAYMPAAKLEAAVAEIRRLTSKPFAINLFVRGPDSAADEVATAASLPIVRAFRGELGLAGDPPAAAA